MHVANLRKTRQLAAEILTTEQILRHVIQWLIFPGRLHRVGCTKPHQIWDNIGSLLLNATFLTVSNETFIDLDFTDDVSLMASMLESLLLKYCTRSCHSLVLDINRTKTHIQAFDSDLSRTSKVFVLVHDVKVFNSFDLDRALCIYAAGSN